MTYKELLELKSKQLTRTYNTKLGSEDSKISVNDPDYTVLYNNGVADLTRVTAGSNLSDALTDIPFISANTIKAGNLKSKDNKTGFDLNNGVIYISDGQKTRVYLSSKNPYFVISKPGFDAETSSDANSLIKVDDNGTKIYFTSTIWSPSIATADAFTGAVGQVLYSTINRQNAAPAIGFIKESSWTIVKCTLYVIFYPGEFDTGSSYINAYPKTVRFYLNGTRNQIRTGTYPANYAYVRFSGGSVLTMDGEANNYINPSDAKYTYSHVFTQSEINSFNSGGWNTIVCQSDNDNADDYGYAVMNLVIEGYSTLI